MADILSGTYSIGNGSGTDYPCFKNGSTGFFDVNTLGGSSDLTGNIIFNVKGTSFDNTNIVFTPSNNSSNYSVTVQTLSGEKRGVLNNTYYSIYGQAYRANDNNTVFIFHGLLVSTPNMGSPGGRGFEVYSCRIGSKVYNNVIKCSLISSWSIVEDECEYYNNLVYRCKSVAITCTYSPVYIFNNIIVSVEGVSLNINGGDSKRNIQNNIIIRTDGNEAVNVIDNKRTLVDAGSSVDAGGGLTDIPMASHPFNPADTLLFYGTTNFDSQAWTINTTYAGGVVLNTTSFIAETFAGTEIVQGDFQYGYIDYNVLSGTAQGWYGENSGKGDDFSGIGTSDNNVYVADWKECLQLALWAYSEKTVDSDSFKHWENGNGLTGGNVWVHHNSSFSVNNGSTTVTFAGSGVLLTHFCKAGGKIKLWNGSAYVEYTIDSITNDSVLELTVNYAGANTSGNQWYQIRLDESTTYTEIENDFDGEERNFDFIGAFSNADYERRLKLGKWIDDEGIGGEFFSGELRSNTETEKDTYYGHITQLWNYWVGSTNTSRLPLFDPQLDGYKNILDAKVVLFLEGVPTVDNDSYLVELVSSSRDIGISQSALENPATTANLSTFNDRKTPSTRWQDLTDISGTDFDLTNLLATTSFLGNEAVNKFISFENDKDSGSSYYNNLIDYLNNNKSGNNCPFSMYSEKYYSSSSTYFKEAGATPFVDGAVLSVLVAEDSGYPQPQKFGQEYMQKFLNN